MECTFCEHYCLQIKLTVCVSLCQFGHLIFMAAWESIYIFYWSSPSELDIGSWCQPSTPPTNSPSWIIKATHLVSFYLTRRVIQDCQYILGFWPDNMYLHIYFLYIIYNVLLVLQINVFNCFKQVVGF